MRLVLTVVGLAIVVNTFSASSSEAYISYYTTQSKETRKKLFGRPPDYVCYWRSHCHFRSGGGCPEAYGLMHFKAAFQVPLGWDVFSMSLEDTLGHPLVMGDGVVQFIPAPCISGDCEVDSLYPAPPGQKWVQMESSFEIPWTCPVTEDSLEFVIRTGLVINAPIATNSPVAVWFSDDRDEVNGMAVEDLYAEAVIDTVRSVGVEPGQPFAPRLLEVSPNPATRGLRVVFSVPSRQVVEVGVYSIDGRRVRSLERGILEVGQHVSSWDGNESNGQRAAPGIYMVRIEASGSSGSTKFAWVQ